MEYKVKDLGSYKLHLIKNDKFKTIRTKVFFNAPVKKKEITIKLVKFYLTVKILLRN